MLAVVICALPAAALWAVGPALYSPEPVTAAFASFAVVFAAIVLANLVFALPFASVARKREGWSGWRGFAIAGGIVGAGLAAMPHLVILRDPEFGLLPYLVMLPFAVAVGAFQGILFWVVAIRGKQI